jgi:hypothetical protein
MKKLIPLLLLLITSLTYAQEDLGFDEIGFDEDVDDVGAPPAAPIDELILAGMGVAILLGYKKHKSKIISE